VLYIGQKISAQILKNIGADIKKYRWRYFKKISKKVLTNRKTGFIIPYKVDRFRFPSPKGVNADRGKRSSFFSV
jgi:hypothetical protein